MSAAMAAAAAAALQGRRSRNSSSSMQHCHYYSLNATSKITISRYEVEKERDWNKFNEYRMNHKPVPLTLRNCRSEHVVEFLEALGDELELGWGKLDALVGRLRVAFEENIGGQPATNPFKAPLVGLYLRQLKEAH